MTSAPLTEAPGGVLGRSRAEHATLPASLPCAPVSGAASLLEERVRPAPDALPIGRAAAAATLDAVVVRAWADLHAGALARCLVCAEPLTAGHGPSGPGGRCAGCGSELS